MGRFRFSTWHAAGALPLVARLIGFEPLGVVLGRGPVAVPVIRLKASCAQVGDVVVTAGAFEASAARRGAALTTLDVLTTAGALGDVTGALNALPGTTRVGTAGQLFVRGGAAARPGHFSRRTVAVYRAITSRWALDGTESVPGVNNAGVPTGGGIAIAFARPVGLSARRVQTFHEVELIGVVNPIRFVFTAPKAAPHWGGLFSWAWRKVHAEVLSVRPPQTTLREQPFWDPGLGRHL